MFRIIPICLCLILLGFMGTDAQAAKRGHQMMTSQEDIAPPGETGEAAEARKLMKEAWALENNNQHYRAMTLYQQALTLREKSLGPEHPATLASLARLARIYSILGFYDKALPLAQQALRLREKVLGPQHPQTAQSLLILGMLYGQMGAQDKAMQMVQRGLQISERMGQENLLTAAALNSLAMLYAQKDSYNQALPLAQRAVQIREKLLGLENPQTAGSLAILGSIYLSKKDYGQAEASFRRAAQRKGELGMVEIDLATGKYEAALDLLTAKLTPKAWNRPQYQALYYTQKGLALKGLGRRKEACEAFLEAIKNIEGLRARTPGERTGFFEFGVFGGYFRAYRGMVGLLAEMAQKGDPFPADLTRYGPDLGAAAFYFAEAIKARSLLEAVAAGATRVAPQVPADLAAKEKSLQEQMQALDAQRVEAMQERGNETGKNSLCKNSG